MANLSLAALLLSTCINSFGSVQAYYSTGGGWPTGRDTTWPTKQPTEEPTARPTGRPTEWPTAPPTSEPSSSPTENPLTKDKYPATEEKSPEAPASGPNPLERAQACPEDLPSGIKIGSDSILLYALVPSSPPGSGNGLLCGRLEVEYETEDGGGWVGLAFSNDGKMVGSEAIIGIPDEKTVLKYDLANFPAAMPDEKQTLRDSSIDQSGGKIIMEFTKKLKEEGEIPILEEGLNNFLFARGGGSLGYHGESRLSFMADFAEDRDIAGNKAAGKSPAEAIGPILSPVEESATGPGLPGKDCTTEFCHYDLTEEYKLRYLMNVPDGSSPLTCEGCTLSMELIHESEAWVAVAFSEDGRMIESEAVM